MTEHPAITPNQVLSNIRAGQYLPSPPSRPYGLSIFDEGQWIQRMIAELKPKLAAGVRQFGYDLRRAHLPPLHLHENILERAWRYAGIDPDKVDKPGDLERVATVYADLITALTADPFGRDEQWELVYAVGETPEAALKAFGATRGWTELTDFEELPNGDPRRFSWGLAFRADGTSIKSAGRAVPGGVIVTWWK